MAADVLHNEINIGDYIAFIEPYYRNLMVGKVVKSTAKMVSIVYFRPDDKRREQRTANQRSSKVVRIDNKDAFIHML